MVPPPVFLAEKPEKSRKNVSGGTYKTYESPRPDREVLGELKNLPSADPLHKV